MDDVLPNQSPYIPRIMQVSELKNSVYMSGLNFIFSNDSLCRAASFSLLSLERMEEFFC